MFLLTCEAYFTWQSSHHARSAYHVPQGRNTSFQKRKSSPFGLLLFLEVTAGFEPADNGVADRGLTTWLRHHKIWSGLRGSNPPPRPWQGRALPNELNPHLGGASGRNRTNDTGIFSPLLYQLSYRGIQQGLHLFRLMATRMGLEPTTSSVTG